MPPRRDPVAGVLADLAGALGALGVRWYVMGAQAAILHGVARATADVDVTIELGSHALRDVVAALERVGFRVRREGTREFVARTRVVPLVHRATRLPVDVVLAGPGIEERFLRRVRRKTVAGRRIPVASVEDLAVMKLLANRPRDVDDVVMLLRLHRDTDREAIRAALTELGAMLDDDLTPRLDAVLRKVGTGGRP